MSDFPVIESGPPMIHTMSRFSVINAESRYTTIGASTVGPFAWTANRATFMPLILPWPFVVRRLFWYNGSTIGSNVDIGIYTEGGGRIYSKGSTAQSGTSVAQYVTPTTPFILPPGRYFLAWNCDGTTNRAYGFQVGSAAIGKAVGLLEQAVGALALPAAATFATYSGATGVPICGISRLASGF